MKANFGIDRNYQKLKQYMPTTTLYGQRENGAASIAQGDNSDYLMELTANYTKQVGDHNFNALVGHSYQLFTYEMFSGKAMTSLQMVSYTITWVRVMRNVRRSNRVRPNLVWLHSSVV